MQCDGLVSRWGSPCSKRRAVTQRSRAWPRGPDRESQRPRESKTPITLAVTVTYPESHGVPGTPCQDWGAMLKFSPDRDTPLKDTCWVSTLSSRPLSG